MLVVGPQVIVQSRLEQWEKGILTDIALSKILRGSRYHLHIETWCVKRKEVFYPMPLFGCREKFDKETTFDSNIGIPTFNETILHFL